MSFESILEEGGLRFQLGIFESLLRRFGNCEKELETLARSPEFAGKRTISVVLEGMRYMHGRMYETAPLLGAPEPADLGLPGDPPQRAQLVQIAATKLDSALA